MRLVIVPQAARVSSRHFVNLAIGLFLDTTLVIVVGLLDFLNTARTAATDPNWPARLLQRGIRLRRTRLFQQDRVRCRSCRCPTATVFSIFLIHGPLGAAFQALRDNPEYATSRGISRFKFQMLVFASSAFFTGLAGGVYAGYYKVMGANTLYLAPLLLLLAMMVVGGLGRTWGPLLGAAVLVLADELLKDYPDYRYMGVGVALVIFVIIWPRGIAGGIEAIARRISEGRVARAAAAGGAPRRNP
jgi:branched-subunit amino acid ABC-type transport system permease component